MSDRDRVPPQVRTANVGELRRENVVVKIVYLGSRPQGTLQNLSALDVAYSRVETDELLSTVAQESEGGLRQDVGLCRLGGLQNFLKGQHRAHAP